MFPGDLGRGVVALGRVDHAIHGGIVAEVDLLVSIMTIESEGLKKEERSRRSNGLILTPLAPIGLSWHNCVIVVASG
jgi:hypothetical protein